MDVIEESCHSESRPFSRTGKMEYCIVLVCMLAVLMPAWGRYTIVFISVHLLCMKCHTVDLQSFKLNILKKVIASNGHRYGTLVTH